ncbi:hypothetical protein C8J44_1087 [Sphingomonas sp. PP-CE-3A-406]|uniref:hypothetical protein n=1 Tax=Sphingomonas sp. PP-CE-3A-406 TaxID=2135659 RepID=UPI000EF8C08B|nr:hypothetical protein [Sphingomonas sp. PP-CE-3A-406]RMB55826.1 hypothetical protein C8J44_1087 [Sphingomonas sp. PP-CE-3A-406]
MSALADVVRRQLAAPTIQPVRDVAEILAAHADVVAVLFYGSNLRTGATEGVLDFYVLTAGPPERGIWPTVSYREFAMAGETLRAKIATMRMATFAKAAAARSLDTTIWTRFVQPSALVWARDSIAADAVAAAIGEATKSAARFAAALGPEAGTADDYWRALFRQTYAAELRVERKGREGQILGFDPDRYTRLLPLAWAADGIAFADDAGTLRPSLAAESRSRLLRAWRRRRRAGKPINVARLVRAAFTFEGAAQYGLWKVERHTGIVVPLTPWREKHPILAAPGIFWRVWRARATAA